MATYFPSTSTGGKRSIEPFDPVSESVVLPKQKKKKAAIKRQRQSNITVIMMKEYCTVIPKGKARQKLSSKGRIQSLRFSRIMSNLEVENQIIRAFKVTNFIVLDCDNTGHNLIKAAEQKIDGEKGYTANAGCEFE